VPEAEGEIVVSRLGRRKSTQNRNALPALRMVETRAEICRTVPTINTLAVSHKRVPVFISAKCCYRGAKYSNFMHFRLTDLCRQPLGNGQLCGIRTFSERMDSEHVDAPELFQGHILCLSASGCAFG
jgi:hypothetical protein